MLLLVFQSTYTCGYSTERQEMPYEIKESDGKYQVVNTETGDVKAEHTDKQDAEDQIKLLHELEKRVEDNGE